jgi:hypothetical protein
MMTTLVILSLMLAFNFVYWWELRKFTKESISPVQSPSIQPGITKHHIFNRNYQGFAFTVLSLLFLLLFWSGMGFELYEIENLDFLLDSYYMTTLVFFVVLISAPSVVFTLFLGGTDFIVNADWVEKHQILRKTKIIRWISVTKVTLSMKGSGLEGVVIHDSKNKFKLQSRMINIEAFYQQALLSLSPSIIGADVSTFIIKEMEIKSEVRRLEGGTRKNTRILVVGVIFLVLFAILMIWTDNLLKNNSSNTGFLIALAITLPLLCGLILVISGIIKVPPTSNIVKSERSCPGINLDRAFYSAQAWLVEERAQIESEDRPLMVSAFHGLKEEKAIWSREGYKRIEMHFVSEDGGTRVTVSIYPALTIYASDVMGDQAKRKAQWQLLAEEALDRISQTAE